MELYKYDGQILRKFQDATDGIAKSNITVEIRDFYTNAKVSLYSNSGGTLNRANPLTTDSNGYYWFYAAQGRYIAIPSDGTPQLDIILGTSSLFDTDGVSMANFEATPTGEQTASATAENRCVFYPYAESGFYNALENDNNVYSPSSRKQAQWFKLKSGTRAAPTTDKDPVMWLQKVIESDNSGGEPWDVGPFYAGLTKMSGSAFAAAVTGFADFVGGTGQIIGVHGRGNAQSNSSEVFGGWSYASCITPGITPISQIGHEINCYRVSGTNIGWQSQATNPGNIRGLVITMADASPVPGTFALEIGNQIGAAKGWYTGIVNQPTSIMPNANPTAIGNGEFMRLLGSPLVADRYGGIRFQSGWWQYGISFAEVDWDKFHNGCAILMGLRQRTVYGATPVEGRYTEVTAGGSFNFQGMHSIYFNGTQILQARIPGFGSAGGTLDASGWTTDSVTTVGFLAQKVGALWYALKTHGLI